jgi:hypothetical protein
MQIQNAGLLTPLADFAEVTTKKTLKLTKNYRLWQAYWSLRVLLLIVSGTAILHLYDLKHGLGYDEDFSYFNSIYPFRQIIPHLWPDHSPLFFFVAHVTLKLFNNTHDLGLQRLPFALLGVALVPLIYGLTQLVTANKKVGLYTAALLAFAPGLLQLTREFRMYTLMLLFSMLATAFLLRALQRNKWLDWVAFILSCSANLYNHYNALIATFGLGVFALSWLIIKLLINWRDTKTKIDSRQKLAWLNTDAFEPDLTTKQVLWRGLALMLSSLAIGLIYGPWFPHFLQLTQAAGFGPNISWVKPTKADNFYKYVSNSGFGPDLGFWLSLTLASLGTGWLLLKRFYYGLFCLCNFWLMFILLNNLPGHDNFIDIARYYCFVVPAFFIAMGQGMAVVVGLVRLVLRKLFKSRRANLRQGLTIAVMLCIWGLLALQASQVIAAEQTFQPQRNALNDLADFLNQTLQPNDVVLTGATRLDNPIFRRNYFINDYITYYMSVNQAQQNLIRPQFVEIENLDSFSRLQKLQASRANIWLLSVAEGEDNLKAQQIAQIKTQAGQFEVHCFQDVCLTKVKTPKPNQYANLTRMLKAFSFMSPDFPVEADKLAHLNLQNLQPVEQPVEQPVIGTNKVGDFYLSAQPTYLSLATDNTTTTQYYCLKFKYQGAPSRLFVSLTDKQGHKTVEPSWEGYTPPPYHTTANDWTADGFIFEVAPNTSAVMLVMLAETDPATLSDLQLFKI